ncbi:MAG TPA: M48 family metallopeptidase [Pyrinomonadaceae bacterium]
MNSFSRLVTALLLATSLLAGSVATFAQDKTQKTDTPAQTQAASTTAKNDGPKPLPPLPTSSGKPLGVNEDPAMIGKRNINKGIISKMSGSTEKEVRLGRELAAEIDRQAKFVDDPAITEYVNRVGQNIVLHSDAKIPFTIKVIDSDEINAFALPGGFFYVNKGLILVADNEAEIAGVMAHEIAHVAARHAVENQTKASLMEYLAMGTSIFLGGVPGMIFQNTAGLGMLGLFMKFSRGAEEEADKLGVQYMYAAGYDPSAMATMFEKLESKNKKKPGFISKAFASHPAPPDRRASALALAARFPEHDEYVISTSEFQRVKGRLLRLSNARATTAGALPGAEEGPPGRPTLKRRQPTPDDPGTTTDGTGIESKPAEKQEAPKLKRNDGTTKPATPDTP